MWPLRTPSNVDGNQWGLMWMKQGHDERAPSLIEQQRLSAKLQTPSKFKLCKQTSAKLQAATLTTTTKPTVTTDVGWYFTRESPVVLPRVACAFLHWPLLNFQGWPCLNEEGNEFRTLTEIKGHAWMLNLLSQLQVPGCTNEWILRTFCCTQTLSTKLRRGIELVYSYIQESSWSKLQMSERMNRVGQNCKWVKLVEIANEWTNESSWSKLRMSERIELVEIANESSEWNCEWVNESWNDLIHGLQGCIKVIKVQCVHIDSMCVCAHILSTGAARTSTVISDIRNEQLESQLARAHLGAPSLFPFLWQTESHPSSLIMFNSRQLHQYQV